MNTCILPRQCAFFLLVGVSLLHLCGCSASQEKDVPASTKPIVHPLQQALVRLTDAQGRTGTYKPAPHRPTLIAFFCGCAPCHALASDWARSLKEPKPVFVVVSGFGDGDTTRFRRATGLQAAYLLDAGKHLRTSLKIASCPHYYLLAPEGRVLAVRDHRVIRPVQERALIHRLLATL